MNPKHHDLIERHWIGRLDPPSRPETTPRHLSVIRQYVRADRAVRAELGDAPAPSIAREVLVKVWEGPRIGFHRDEAKQLKGVDFGSKLMLVPWSIEAFDSFKANGSVKGLVLEHVTPIAALWEELGKLDAEAEDEDDWLRNAETYLWIHYTVAVLTAAQARAIDSIPTLKTVGCAKEPFLRYKAANERLAPPITPDVRRFILPGHLPSPTAG